MMKKLSADASLRKHLISLLEDGNAHITFADAVKDFPFPHAAFRPEGSPHSAWELLEHLRIAQEDILRFSTNDNYAELKWPDDYWPTSQGPSSKEEWDSSIESVRRDLAQFIELIKTKQNDLFEAFRWGSGQTLLREALVIADHNSYHVGQLMLLRRMLESQSG